MKKLLIVICMLPIFVQADQDGSESGKARIAAIMAHEQMGVTAYNKRNCNYAEINENLGRDLNIKEISRFFACKTEIGQSFLEQTMALPLSPKDRDTTLARRKQVIKVLVEHSELKKEVDHLLERACQAEQNVAILMSDSFIGRTCPELKKLELIKQQNPYGAPIAEFFLKNPIPRTVGTAFAGVSIAATAYMGGLTAQAAYKVAQLGLDYRLPAGVAAYYGLTCGTSSYQFYKDYSFALEKRSKIHALYELITIAERVEQLSSKHGLMPQFKISDIADANGRYLIQKLKSSRYKHKTAYLFIAPLVHTFLYDLYQNDNHLAELFACIAEMDAYNAIATKMIESKQTKHPFCFARVIDAQKPQVCTEQFWNVLVTNAVPNSFTEGKHIILTGPNAGGKTTAIRALLQNIVLAQSFGVAAAQKFEYTMFDVIHSYLNVSDNILQGLSLFASEVKRAQTIVQRMRSLEHGHKFFFALDELFTGTVAEDGEKCAYEFVKRIAEFDGAQFIYATHFNKLKQLGNESDRCINYKVNAPIKNSAGKLVYPFTLSQGTNETSVALDIAQEAGLFD